MIVGIHFAHACSKRLFSFHLQEKTFGRIGIRNRDEIGILDRKRAVQEVVGVAPAAGQEQSEAGQNNTTDEQKIAIGPADLPADEVIPHEVTSVLPARRE